MPTKTTDARVNGDPSLKVRRRPGRVPVSCAECRRLKVRCDRKVPCESCIKRGCAAVCPDAALVVGKNNRLILANTEELHEEIDRLRTRLRQAEHELSTTKQQTSSSSPSDRSSPLSSEDINVATCRTPLEGGTCQSNPLKEEDQDGFIDAFGTLTIGSRGGARYLGKTARTEFLISALRPNDYVPNFPRISREMLDASLSIPQGYHNTLATNDSVKKELIAMLPPLGEAYRLCEIFYENGKYLYTPMPRSEIFEEILGAVYQSGPPNVDEIADVLGLLYIIFAIALITDPSSLTSQFPPEADEYCILSKVASNLCSPLSETTLWWVQSLAYVAVFVDMRDVYGTSKAWVDNGTAVKFGESIGLHLKSARWKLDEETEQKRCRLFWQLFTQDAWFSFGFGRPANISLEYIECDLPADTDPVVDPATGQKEPSYHAWSLQYAVMLRSAVMRIAWGAKSPSYFTILDLDRRIREFPVPNYLQPLCHTFTEGQPPHAVMQRLGVLAAKEATLLHLHRGYFAQALQDLPDEPLKHKYGVSVMATYRSAYRLIVGLDESHKIAPKHCTKNYLAWSHALSASIVMCLLVTRARKCNMTVSALDHLDKACDLFERAAPVNQGIARSLTALQNLHRQAHEAVNNSRFDHPSPLPSAELDRLGGKTQLISEPSSRASHSPPAFPPSIHNSMDLGEQHVATVPDVAEQQYLGTLPQNVHPAIMQEMMTFEGYGTWDTNQPTIPMADLPLDSYSVPSDLLDAAASAFPQWHDQSKVAPDFYPLPAFHIPNHIEQTIPSSSPWDNSGQGLDSMWQNFVEQLGFGVDQRA
ncbi:hypothetical protein JAAARDRAFT_188604 [Jaapia argillacea MUCL 33604]|uniref:Zn(2)-C6 fungal-type domain-containing protein n=1 Tax=Jaapia argillacea MUCL 33604 TaxID=933084 RepID=A0A067QA06_9AGAM|nr:hypothetical protein JAAARDRAFT_188604 [Jaapia argillacea MUCL 33604]